MNMIKVLIIGFFLLSLLPSVLANNKVALIVKDANFLSVKHEEKIYRTLTEMGFDVIPIDNPVDVNYSDYIFIVVAGRPADVYSYENLGSFVADIPVNDYPTIAIDSVYPDDWGWVEPGGISTLSSTLIQKVVVLDNTHPITEDRPVGEVITVHTVSGQTILDFINGRTELTPLVTIPGISSPVIAVGDIGTTLSNNETTSTRIVFFGITNPIYWTYDAENLFKKSVQWILEDNDGDEIPDALDNCPDIFNPNQLDTDNDGFGNLCDEDDDNDGIPDISDFCSLEDATGFDNYIGRGISTPGQDGCVDDEDSDNIKDNMDNCLDIYNPDQEDSDDDDIGNVCDTCPYDPEDDADNDGICGDVDNCPFKYNPDQEDSDDDGRGDACRILPYQIFRDVDEDGVNETAINENNISDDGFEVYEDYNPNDINSQAMAMEGDLDGMTDWLIDIVIYGNYDKYWDPDDDILTDVISSGDEYLIDIDGDNVTDLIYSSIYNALIIRRNVDSDSELEIALDRNMDRSYDDYRDSDGYSRLLDILDGDNDGKNDFIIGFDVGYYVYKPAKYWDPDDNILTDIEEVDTDNDGENEYLIDIDGDGVFDKVYNDDQLHDLPDLVVDSIYLIPDSPKSGDNVTVGVTVINIGGQDVIDFKVEVKIDETLLGSVTISLNEGDSTNLEFEWNDFSTGSHVIKSIVDSENVIIESNEENNEKTKDLSSSSSQTTTENQPSSGGGGGSFIPRGSAEFTGFSDKVEVFIGDEITLNGKFESTFNYNLYDVTFSLEADGLNPNWYSFSPETEYKITEGGKINVLIKFNIPEDAEIYTYPIVLKASAGSKVGDKIISEEFTLILLEKLEVLTTTSTTTSSTTTTTIPEEERPEPSPLTGLYSFVQTNSLIITIIVVVIIGIIYFIRPKGKGEYVFGKGWVKFISKFKNLSTEGLKSLLTKW